MFWKLAADAVALTHLAFILFVVLGGVLLLRWPRIAWIHVPAAVWGALIEFAGWYCPLTSIENDCLRRAGEAPYSGGFVAHYIFRLIYPAGLTRGIEIAIGLFVVVVNVGLYVRAFR